MLAAGLLCGTARAADVDLPTLLHRLADQQTKLDEGAKHLNYTRLERNEELDSTFQPVHVVERMVRVEHPDGGTEHEVLVREARDGQDITAQTQPRFDEAQERYREMKVKDPKKRDSFQADSPFKATEQPKYQFRLLPLDPKDGGRRRIAFSPATTRPPTPEMIQGEALVDLSSGLALYLNMRPAALPRFVTRAESSLEFGAVGAIPVVKKLTFAGEGGALFIKNRFRGTISYQDFKPLP